MPVDQRDVSEARCNGRSRARPAAVLAALRRLEASGARCATELWRSSRLLTSAAYAQRSTMMHCMRDIQSPPRWRCPLAVPASPPIPLTARLPTSASHRLEFPQIRIPRLLAHFRCCRRPPGHSSTAAHSLTLPANPCRRPQQTAAGTGSSSSGLKPSEHSPTSRAAPPRPPPPPPVRPSDAAPGLPRWPALCPAASTRCLTLCWATYWVWSTLQYHGK